MSKRPNNGKGSFEHQEPQMLEHASMSLVVLLETSGFRVARARDVREGVKR